MSKKIAIVVGENSGDQLGASLIKALKQISNEPLEFIGIGGKSMIAEGFESLFPMEEIAVMGFFEVIPHLKRIYNKIKDTIKYIKTQKPDMLITIDCPDFSFRVAKELKGLGIKLVHYVAPSVWAYRANRAQKIARIYDLLLTLWPFEPHFFTVHGLRAEFVGNAFLETTEKLDRNKFRHDNNIASSTTVICVMPGSRKSELHRILPCFSKALSELNKKIYDMTVVIPSVSKQFSEFIKREIDGAPYRTIVTETMKDKQEIFAASNLALIKSGTSTIEVAAHLVPMVIGYKANPLSIIIAKLLVKVQFINIINIIKNREIIPEFVQSRCRPDYLAKALYELHINRSKAKKQIDETIKVLKDIGLHFDPAPSERAAKIILELLELTSLKLN
jgi:lipid-A-disaccharide synthase